MTKEFKKHPSFGSIVLSKITSTGRRLFGSELQHSNFISMKLYEAEIHQDLHKDTIYASKPLFEVYISEAQWAHIISSFNESEGTPVTIRSNSNGRVEETPVLPSIVDTQKEKTYEITEGIRKKALDLRDKLLEMHARPTVRKGDLADLSKQLDILASHVTSNIDYITDCVLERLEAENAKARIEIEAMVTNAINKLGMKALQEARLDPMTMIGPGLRTPPDQYERDRAEQDLIKQAWGASPLSIDPKEGIE